MILRTLTRGEMHRYGIAQHLQERLGRCASGRGELALPGAATAPAERLGQGGLGASEDDRRARYYTLTAAGRKRLAAERQEFDALVLAIQKVLNAT